MGSRDIFAPWPMEVIREQLCTGGVLGKLCKAREPAEKNARREQILEDLVQAVVEAEYGSDRVYVRRGIGHVLGVGNPGFPATKQPDVVLRLGGEFHVCELKASRTDYARRDDVFDSQPFRTFLQSQGHRGRWPWEVEQDLIKLRLFLQLSNRVSSCVFLMVDAYSGAGTSWAEVFGSAGLLRRTMRTDSIRGIADELVSATRIDEISADSMKARVIACAVHEGSR